MNKPHVHAEVIKAWADGAEIEFYDFYANKWFSFSNDETICSWNPNMIYRVKPKVLHKIGNIYKFGDGTKSMLICCSSSEVVMGTIDGPLRGCRSSDSVKVENRWSITEEEFSEIVGGNIHDYTLIETND